MRLQVICCHACATCVDWCLPHTASSLLATTNPWDMWSDSRSVAAMKDVTAYSNASFNPLETIQHLIEAIGRAERIEEIYEEALCGLQDTVAANRASILLFDADGVMRFKAWHGLSDTYRAATEGHSPWAIKAANPQPVLVSDIDREPMADT